MDDQGLQGHHAPTWPRRRMVTLESWRQHLAAAIAAGDEGLGAEELGVLALVKMGRLSSEMQAEWQDAGGDPATFERLWLTILQAVTTAYWAAAAVDAPPPPAGFPDDREGETFDRVRYLARAAVESRAAGAPAADQSTGECDASDAGT